MQWYEFCLLFAVIIAKANIGEANETTDTIPKCPPGAQHLTDDSGEPLRCLPHHTDLCVKAINGKVSDLASADVCCHGNRVDYYCCVGMSQQDCPDYANVTVVVFHEQRQFIPSNAFSQPQGTEPRRGSTGDQYQSLRGFAPGPQTKFGSQVPAARGPSASPQDFARSPFNPPPERPSPSSFPVFAPIIELNAPGPLIDPSELGQGDLLNAPVFAPTPQEIPAVQTLAKAKPVNVRFRHRNEQQGQPPQADATLQDDAMASEMQPQLQSQRQESIGGDENQGPTTFKFLGQPPGEPLPPVPQAPGTPPLQIPDQRSPRKQSSRQSFVDHVPPNRQSPSESGTFSNNNQQLARASNSEFNEEAARVPNVEDGENRSPIEHVAQQSGTTRASNRNGISATPDFNSGQPRNVSRQKPNTASGQRSALPHLNSNSNPNPNSNVNPNSDRRLSSNRNSGGNPDLNLDSNINPDLNPNPDPNSDQRQNLPNSNRRPLAANPNSNRRQLVSDPNKRVANNNRLANPNPNLNLGLNPDHFQNPASPNVGQSSNIGSSQPNAKILPTRNSPPQQRSFALFHDDASPIMENRRAAQEPMANIFGGATINIGPEYVANMKPSTFVGFSRPGFESARKKRLRRFLN